MTPYVLHLLVAGGILLAPAPSGAAPASPWRLPRDRASYLMEDDLVYARFLRLAQGGTYQQIDRDERGSAEVDRGHWEQGSDGVLRLHSTCHALRARSVRSGPLSVMIGRSVAPQPLEKSLASWRHFLHEYGDAVFKAGTLAEIDLPGAANIQMDPSSATFSRSDAEILVTRLADVVASGRTGTYLLRPAGKPELPGFALAESAFGGGDEVAAAGRLPRGASPTGLPFDFAPITGQTYAREVGRWRPLHLPGSPE